MERLMTLPLTSIGGLAPTTGLNKPDAAMASETAEAEMGRRFEELLWSEMLKNAGLEKALTMNGGEGASAFSRYVIDEIASDLADKHPLGLSERTGLYAEMMDPSVKETPE
jgi:hypothetical protein